MSQSGCPRAYGEPWLSSLRARTFCSRTGEGGKERGASHTAVCVGLRRIVVAAGAGAHTDGIVEAVQVMHFLLLELDLELLLNGPDPLGPRALLRDLLLDVLGVHGEGLQPAGGDAVLYAQPGLEHLAL